MFQENACVFVGPVVVQISKILENNFHVQTVYTGFLQYSRNRVNGNNSHLPEHRSIDDQSPVQTYCLFVPFALDISHIYESRITRVPRRPKILLKM